MKDLRHIKLYIVTVNESNEKRKSRKATWIILEY